MNCADHYVNGNVDGYSHRCELSLFPWAIHRWRENLHEGAEGYGEVLPFECSIAAVEVHLWFEVSGYGILEVSVDMHEEHRI